MQSAENVSAVILPLVPRDRSACRIFKLGHSPLHSPYSSKEGGIMNLPTATAIVVSFVAFSVMPATGQSKSEDEAKIEALNASLTAAVNAEDVNAIMKVYVPDESLVIFDIIPPRQYLGAKAFRKDWEDFLTLFKGPLKYEISDLHIEADGTLGYSHSIQRVKGTDTKGQPVDLTWRDTAAYRKIDGKWLIVHEHGSVPVDLATGKPDLMSKQ
jgi:ketosteroid isomerase-like protein